MHYGIIDSTRIYKRLVHFLRKWLFFNILLAVECVVRQDMRQCASGLLEWESANSAFERIWYPIEYCMQGIEKWNEYTNRENRTLTLFCGSRYNITLFKDLTQDETFVPLEEPQTIVELATWNVFYFCSQCTPISRQDYTDHPLDLVVSRYHPKYTCGNLLKVTTTGCCAGTVLSLCVLLETSSQKNSTSGQTRRRCQTKT